MTRKWAQLSQVWLLFHATNPPQNTNVIVTGKFDKERKLKRGKSARPGSSMQWELTWAPHNSCAVIRLYCSTCVSCAGDQKVTHSPPCFVCLLLRDLRVFLWCPGQFQLCLCSWIHKTATIKYKHLEHILLQQHIYTVWSWTVARGPAGPAARRPDVASPR